MEKCSSKPEGFQELFPKKHWNKLHLQIIFMGGNIVKLGIALVWNVKYVHSAIQKEKANFN